METRKKKNSQMINTGNLSCKIAAFRRKNLGFSHSIDSSYIKVRLI